MGEPAKEISREETAAQWISNIAHRIERELLEAQKRNKDLAANLGEMHKRAIAAEAKLAAVEKCPRYLPSVCSQTNAQGKPIQILRGMSPDDTGEYLLRADVLAIIKEQSDE